MIANQISDHRLESIEITLCPAEFERDVPTLHVSGLIQTIAKCSYVMLSLIERRVGEESYHRHRRLLRARRNRPRCRAAEQCDEVAAGHSISSSARPDSGSGTVMPSVLATLRLMKSSTFVTCCTGRSEGFSPFRMRPA